MFKTGAVAAVLLLTTSAGWAQGLNLDVKTGLWEVTAQGQMSGAPPIPPEALAHMTPEQRQRIEQSMQASMANMNTPHTRQHCVTEEDLRRGFDMGNDRENCTRTVVSQTPRKAEVKVQCTGEHQMTGTLHLEAPDRETFHGSFDMVLVNGGQKTTMHQTMSGRWLGSSCGNVKPNE